MPRTKQVKKYGKNELSEKATLLKLIEEKHDALLRELNSEDMKLAALEAENDTIVAMIKQRLIKYKDVRLKDLDTIDITNSLSVINTLSTTKASYKRERPRTKRSISDNAINKTENDLLQSASKYSTISCDSGHSSRFGSSDRTTVKACHKKPIAKTRRSRSLSHNGKSALPLRSMRTPMGQRTAIMAPITPKMKDCNSHPALMRRPQQNEIAFSLQGSPLMVNNVMTDTINANIPLSDGRVIALQSEYMRLSDIGDIRLEPESISDLQQLRDNLTKLCKSLKNSQNKKK